MRSRTMALEPYRLGGAQIKALSPHGSGEVQIKGNITITYQTSSATIVYLMDQGMINMIGNNILDNGRVSEKRKELFRSFLELVNELSDISLEEEVEQLRKIISMEKQSRVEEITD